jgi:SAM-dependent methyltransferase
MSESAEYDAIAESYLKWASRVEFMVVSKEYTLFHVMIMLNEHGSLMGKRALDLACGDGRYTRLLHEHGCSSVTDMDASQRMIDLACRHKKHGDDTIVYLCADCTRLPPVATTEPCFDLVTAVHFLHYARTRDELRGMAQGIFDRLKTGGNFYCINHNVTASNDIMYNNDAHRKYGLVMYVDDMEKPYAFEVKPFDVDTREAMGFSFANHHLISDVYESVFT